MRFLVAAGVMLAANGVVCAAELSDATQNLFDAIQSNDLAAAQTSIDDGADLSARNSLGMLPVDLAVERGHFEIAHYLLSRRQIEGSQSGSDDQPKRAAGAVARPALPVAPVQSTPLTAELPSAPSVSEPPVEPPSAPGFGQIPDPFNPSAVPESARHPVITGTKPLDPDGGVAEPPPPPAIPEETEDTHSQATPAIRPVPERPEVADIPPPATANPDLLNRIGDMLGLDEPASETTPAAPPPVPPAVAATPETEEEVAETPEPASDIEDAALTADESAAASVESPPPVEAPEPPAVAEIPSPAPAEEPVPVAEAPSPSPVPDVPEPAKEPEPIEEPEPVAEAPVLPPEVDDSLEAVSDDTDLTEPPMAAAPPPPPLLTPPLLDSDGETKSFAEDSRPALANGDPAAEVAKLSAGEPPVDDASPVDAEAAPIPDTAPAKTFETAAPDLDDTPGPADADAKPSVLSRVTEDLDETVDHFLGGWFFKWMGRKMGIAEVEEGAEERSQSSPEAGAAVAISDLAPRSSAPPEPVPTPLADAVLSSEPLPEPPPPAFDALAEVREAEVTAPDTPLETPAAPDIPAVEEPEQIAALPEETLVPPEPELPPGLPEEPVAESPQPEEIPSAAEPPIPPGLTDGLRIVAAAPEEPSEPAPPAAEPSPDVLPDALPDIEAPAEPADTVAADGGELTEIGGLDAVPDPLPEEPAVSSGTGTPAVALGDLPIAAPVDAPISDLSDEEEQLTEIGDLGLGDERLNPVRSTGADAFGPTAVPPGSTHPVIGEVAPKPPKPEPSLSDLDLGDDLAALRDSETPAEVDELDALASDLGAETPADGGDGLMSRLSQFLETDDPTMLPDQSADGAAQEDGGLSELAALANDVGVVTTQPVPSAVATQLPETVLTLGESVHLTSLMPARPDDPSEASYCVEKNRNNIVFCVEPVDWPPDLADELRVSTIMYQGAQAVVRYDDGQATRFHAIFPVSGFQPLVAYYSRRFGPPTETSMRKIAPFGRPRQENPVYVWRRDDPLSGRKTSLEVRQYDDGRGGFPDLRHGAVMLYNEASQPIFPVLSALDLMPTTGTN